MKTCAGCPTPGKCRAAGKCLNPKKSTKTMGNGNKSGGYGS